jgi:hypothetical protein
MAAQAWEVRSGRLKVRPIPSDKETALSLSVAGAVFGITRPTSLN